MCPMPRLLCFVKSISVEARVYEPGGGQTLQYCALCVRNVTCVADSCVVMSLIVSAMQCHDTLDDKTCTST